MFLIQARNVNDALTKGMKLLGADGQKRGSRNGEVLVMDGPVSTMYERPRERVLFWPDRDANPFFHLFEALWMLNGNRDVAPLEHYVKRMKGFSDDGKVLHGAYGYRWLHHFKFDQLSPIIGRLKKNPDDRRCVLQMWDARADLDMSTKDQPCNTQAYFSRDYLGQLDMTVCCRSNDIIWGAYGANAVHFSMLQEFIAAGIGCEVGRYWQMSNNFHAYTKTFGPLYAASAPTMDLYPARVVPFPMVNTDLEAWRFELDSFINDRTRHFEDDFFTCVAVPMRMAYNFYRAGKLEDALKIARMVRALDWNLAACRWLERRLARRKS